MQSIIDALLERGYKYKEWSERFHKGRTRVYFNKYCPHMLSVEIMGSRLPFGTGSETIAVTSIDARQGVDNVIAEVEDFEQQIAY